MPNPSQSGTGGSFAGNGSPPTRGDGTTQSDVVDQPVGTGEYEVKPGECMLSIARQTGHFWETIWNDPANKPLQDAGRKPNQLLPGDKVHIPDKARKDESCPAESRHRFVRKGEPSQVRVFMRDANEPWANEPYTLVVDGKTFEGVTDANGGITVPARGDATTAILTIRGRQFSLQLGQMDPVFTVSGIQARLKNLGMYAGQVNGKLDDPTRAAIRTFQQKHGLTVSGEPDAEMRALLELIHDKGEPPQAAGEGDDSEARVPDLPPEDDGDDPDA
jgi:N-acetylmuramoyl-L-alanine amidase